ncbi:MAG: DUF4345 domain-containing protein [Planctomycetia bacterium]|nr:DUF4345 domain-containing protein [Planctomycetia bacterium]
MVVAYLAFNAVLYAVLGLWCALAPGTTSTFVGLAPVGAAGASEWLAVYGGMQLGFAAWFGLAAARPAHRASGLAFAALVYGGIVALRTTAVARVGFEALGNARFAYGLELGLLAAALVLLARRR